MNTPVTALAISAALVLVMWGIDRWDRGDQ
jgi:hypothetical protein